MLHKPGAVRSVDRICIVRASAWRWLGWTRDIGRHVLLSYFQTVGSSSSPSLLPHILVYRIPQGGRYYKYKEYTMHYVIMWINNDVNKAVINDDYWRSTNLILAFKSSCAREMSSSKVIGNLGTRVQKGSPAVLGTMRGLMVNFILGTNRIKGLLGPTDVQDLLNRGKPLASAGDRSSVPWPTSL
jgi:hypothetical protein